MSVAVDRFRLDVEQFEGPLDLLLYLIRKDDLDLLQLSVSRVAEQYLRYIDTLTDMNLDLASEYLVMAATLTWMKSRLLLPRGADDEDEVEDLRAELIARLIEYERFKRAAERLDDRPMLYRELFPARVLTERPDDRDRPWATASVFQLMEVFRDMIAAMPEPGESALQMLLPERTIEHGAQALMRLLSERPRRLLRELLADAVDRADLIVRFLALLELVNLGELLAVVEGDGGEVHVARRDATTDMPDYGAMVRGATHGTAEDHGDH